MREWISVKDRLPEDLGYRMKYLTTGIYNGNKTDVKFDVCSYISENNWFRSIGFEEYRYKITNWMPIPEPPEVTDD